MYQLDCQFCLIHARKAPATIVTEDRHSVGVVPLNPVTTGHIIFISSIHVLPSHDGEWTGRVVSDATRYATSGHHMTGHYNIIINSGADADADADATQIIPHLHVHVIPRRTGDGLLLPWNTTP